MSKHPAVLWAQRSDKLFLTIELADAQNPVIKIEPDGIFSFSATAGEDNAEYTLDLEFFGDLDKEKSKIQIGKRLIFCVLAKKETGHWDKLLKTPGKAPPYVRVDWEKWVDEDEETSRPNFDNFDLSSMDDMSKFDLGGGADSDDDDGDVPDLELEK